MFVSIQEYQKNQKREMIKFLYKMGKDNQFKINVKRSSKWLSIYNHVIKLEEFSVESQ